MVETLGEFELLFIAAKSSIKFAFPHRERELNAYRDYITGYFTVTHPKFY
jgi:hypothetical protein